MSAKVSGWTLTSLTVIVGLGLGREAAAGNGQHPRTPVDWTGAPCMTIIDRSQSSIFPLVYTIPMEDTEVTEDEVDDSRTHQFFAFCRDHHREEIVPGWITEADLADADAHGLGDAAAVDTELEVLELAPEWADCFVRINADDQRRPITFAAAAEPVAWDVSMLATGAWAIEGYTYEPWFNAWWPHPGVFKVIDDPDPAASGPAAALTFAEQGVELGDQATITGCVDAMPGSTMTASWAISGFGTEPQWVAFETDVPVNSGSFELIFTPPEETVSNPLLIKVDVSDPMGRTWTAHGLENIIVTEDFGEDGCGGGGFVSCETDDGGETEAETTGDPSGEGSSSGDTGLPAQDSSAGSCNCSTRAAQEVPWRGSGLALLMIVGLRRRLSSRRAA